MTTDLTVRERRRRAARAEILDAARVLVVDVGAEQLALRAVARTLRMSPAALYEYFPGRDALLAALLADTYGRLADALEAASGGPGPAPARFTATMAAYRDWALEHREEFVLLYATRVPGLRLASDETTTQNAARAGAVLRGLVGELTGAPAPHPSDAAFLSAWGQVHGLVMLEVFGHLAITGADPAGVYESTVAALVTRLRPPESAAAV